MKKLAVVALVAALGLAGMAQPALAGGWFHHRSHHHGNGWVAAGVALTGLAVLDAMLSPRPVVYAQPAVAYSEPQVIYAPPPVYYAPPPVYYAPPVCRPVYAVPRVIYQRPAYCPPPRPAYPYGGGGWRR